MEWTVADGTTAELVTICCLRMSRLCVKKATFNLYSYRNQRRAENQQDAEAKRKQIDWFIRLFGAFADLQALISFSSDAFEGLAGFRRDYDDASLHKHLDCARPLQ